jgi:dCMP deaminase
MSWERYALNLAEAASFRSEDPYVQVGACALGEDNRVLSVGYNGLAAGKKAPDNFWEDRGSRRPYMIHAEANCLSLCRRGEVKLLAVTLLPCSACASLIASYKIPTVVYNKVYERDKIALDIFDFYGIDYYII